MSKPITSLDSLSNQPWIQAELSYVQQILDYLFEEEARQAPAVAKVFRGFSIARGKLLRPLLVLLGARTAAAEFHPGYPEKQPDPPTPQVLRGMRDRDAKILDKLKRTGWSSSAGINEEIETWKQQPPFPGALPRRIYLLAASLELLHLATLVHDDVIDEAHIRRGKVSVWKQIGASQAVLLGDLMLSLTFALVSHGAQPETGQLLSGMVRVMCRSEFFQVEDRNRFLRLLKNPSRRRYIRIITGKTALLFSLALHVGAREMGASPGSVQMLRRAGYYLGLAFQIQDDILDFKGDQKKFGKQLGQDLKDGQLTLPVIEALRRHPKKTEKMQEPSEAPGTGKSRGNQVARDNSLRKKQLIKAIVDFRQGDDSQFPLILDSLRVLGGFSGAENEAQNYTIRAEAEIHRACDGIGITQIKELLINLNTVLTSRRY
jgi:geranylgeranyl pyrophosphate synthase